MRNTLSYQQSTYENDKIKSAQMAVDTSLNERVLDVDTMNATVESETALVPFQQNTPVRFLRGGSQYALWYLAQITRVAPKLWALSMTSSLGRLTQMPHKGGIYNGVAASAIIDDICGVVPHFVGAAFQNVLLYGWLPYVAPSGENGAQTGSAKDNLLKVLFALNATVRDDADGTLRIENLSTAVSARLSPARIYRDNASVVTEPTVTAVTVLEHQYITGSETTTLFEGTTVDGQVIVFREPMSNLTATGFTVTESNANYAVVSAGSGTLTGTPYIHTTREITKPVTAAAIPNAVRIEDATLVGVTNSSDVVNRLVDYYSHRTYINVDATIDLEDAGDVVDIYDPFDKLMRQACIEKISPLVVSQTMKGRISALVGFTPWQVVPFEDVRELLTGSGTWTVPEGVTEIRAVLIGGGQGGESGSPGSPSTECKAINQTSEVTDSTTTYRGWCPMIGGAGGNKGAGGEGGKVLTVSQVVTAGEKITYAAGRGGKGGAYSADAQTSGSGGTDTVFGSHSSATGSTTETGYYDPVSGDTYAAHGADGINGGAGGGGNGETNNTDYVAGESVTDNAGNTWLPGENPTDSDVLVDSASAYGFWGNSKHWTCSAKAVQGKGAGGGAAVGANGKSGVHNANAPYAWSRSGTADGDLYPHGKAISFAYGGVGGKGADATAPVKATVYGSGGTGGNGGGGAGGGGFAYGEKRVSKEYPPTECSASGNKGQSGTPGLGSDGGQGADGCIILYYRRPVTE